VAKPEDCKSAEAVCFVMEEHLVEGNESSGGFGLMNRGRPDGIASERSDNRRPPLLCH
jgi:hypothetical protein